MKRTYWINTSSCRYCFAFLLVILSAKSLLSKSILVELNTKEIDGFRTPWSLLKGGDTIFLNAGIRSAIQLNNFSGNAKKNLVVINFNGLVEIRSASLPYGISMRNCHYLKLTGAGTTKFIYGIKIAHVLTDGAGIGISDRSDNIEVEHIEISNTKGPGLLCKTNPSCNTTKNFSAYNYSIHNNYVHHTGTEGLYIGSTAFEGEEIICDGQKTKILPPVLYNVKVFSNRVEYTGWDGIQISNTHNALCHNNTVLYDSQSETEWQNCGIIIGGGTSGKFYDNIIAHGKGYAFNCFGSGSVQLFGNKIKMDNATGKLAVYLNDKLAGEKTVYIVSENDIATTHFPAVKCVNKKESVVYTIYRNKITPVVSEDKYLQIEK